MSHELFIGIFRILVLLAVLYKQKPSLLYNTSPEWFVTLTHDELVNFGGILLLVLGDITPKGNQKCLESCQVNDLTSPSEFM